MLNSELVFEELSRNGFNFYSGVPCSYLKPLINQAITRECCSYIGAAQEGEALGLAIGAYLAGKRL